MFFDQRAHIFRLGAHAYDHLRSVKEESLDTGARERQIVGDRQHQQQHG